MRLEHHLVGGYVRYISPHIIIIIINKNTKRYIKIYYEKYFCLKYSLISEKTWEIFI